MFQNWSDYINKNLNKQFILLGTYSEGVEIKRFLMIQNYSKWKLLVLNWSIVFRNVSTSIATGVTVDLPLHTFSAFIFSSLTSLEELVLGTLCFSHDENRNIEQKHKKKHNLHSSALNYLPISGGWVFVYKYLV